ncbi:hypothetical protein TrLO_g8360 [Triparma laevis f. longispina]|uniref:Uncharacterized protein n=1 Tax=Triparma laevis f. longispina TaxID=1714387 RepID=A0A9W6ZF09_9STRA|nr:hypothetical protein TrLO_g8360 [Triparma laevis f. longispina]
MLSLLTENLTQENYLILFALSWAFYATRMFLFPKQLVEDYFKGVAVTPMLNYPMHYFPEILVVVLTAGGFYFRE